MVGARPTRASSRGSTSEHFTSKITARSEEHTSELQSPCNLVCRLLLEKKKHNERLKAITIIEGAEQAQLLPTLHPVKGIIDIEYNTLRHRTRCHVISSHEVSPHAHQHS